MSIEIRRQPSSHARRRTTWVACACIQIRRGGRSRTSRAAPDRSKPSVDHHEAMAGPLGVRFGALQVLHMQTAGWRWSCPASRSTVPGWCRWRSRGSRRSPAQRRALLADVYPACPGLRRAGLVPRSALEALDGLEVGGAWLVRWVFHFYFGGQSLSLSLSLCSSALHVTRFHLTSRSSWLRQSEQTLFGCAGPLLVRLHRLAHHPGPPPQQQSPRYDGCARRCA